MSGPIQSHAGENKRVSNYSLGVWVGWLQFVGDESTAGRGTERKSEREEERRQAWFMKEINSELPPSGYEIWVGICFLIVTGAVVRIIIHEAARRVSKQKGKPSERKALFCGDEMQARPD